MILVAQACFICCFAIERKYKQLSISHTGNHLQNNHLKKEHENRGTTIGMITSFLLKISYIYHCKQLFLVKRLRFYFPARYSIYIPFKLPLSFFCRLSPIFCCLLKTFLYIQFSFLSQILSQQIIIFFLMVRLQSLSLLATLFLCTLQSAIIKQDAINLTLYTNNLGIIKDLRSIQLDQGQSQLKYSEFSYKFQRNTITFRSVSHPKTVKMVEEEYSKPQIQWIISSDKSQLTQCQIGYRSLGFNWIVDYTLEIDQGQNRADFVGWVTLVNKSGKQFINASIKLVSGQLNVIETQPTNIELFQPLPSVQPQFAFFARDPSIQELTQYDIAPRAPPPPPPSFAKSQVSDYHSYKLNRKITLGDGNEKRVEFIQRIKNIEIEKQYEIQVTGGGENEDLINANSLIRIRNQKKNNLGFYLPGGDVRIFQEDKFDKSLEFSADANTDGVSEGKNMTLFQGTVYDIPSQKKVLSKKEWLNEFNTTDFNATCTIKITNSKSIPARVVLKFYNPYGDTWTISPIKKKKETKLPEVNIYRIRQSFNATLSSESLTPTKQNANLYKIVKKLEAGEVWEYGWEEKLRRVQ